MRRAVVSYTRRRCTLQIDQAASASGAPIVRDPSGSVRFDRRDILLIRPNPLDSHHALVHYATFSAQPRVAVLANSRALRQRLP